MTIANTVESHRKWHLIPSFVAHLFSIFLEQVPIIKLSAAIKVWLKMNHTCSLRLASLCCLLLWEQCICNPSSILAHSFSFSLHIRILPLYLNATKKLLPWEGGFAFQGKVNIFQRIIATPAIHWKSLKMGRRWICRLQKFAVENLFQQSRDFDCWVYVTCLSLLVYLALRLSLFPLKLIILELWASGSGQRSWSHLLDLFSRKICECASQVGPGSCSIRAVVTNKVTLYLEKVPSTHWSLFTLLFKMVIFISYDKWFRGRWLRVQEDGWLCLLFFLA